MKKVLLTLIAGATLLGGCGQVKQRSSAEPAPVQASQSKANDQSTAQDKKQETSNNTAPTQPSSETSAQNTVGQPSNQTSQPKAVAQATAQDKKQGDSANAVTQHQSSSDTSAQNQSDKLVHEPQDPKQDFVRDGDGMAKGVEVIMGNYGDTKDGNGFYDLKITNSTDRTLSVSLGLFAAKTKNGELKVSVPFVGRGGRDSQLLPGGHIDSYHVEFDTKVENIDSVLYAQEDYGPVAVAEPAWMAPPDTSGPDAPIPGANVKADNFSMDPAAASK